MKVMFVRPYYGININGDMGGDIGTVDYSMQISPDLSFLYSVSLAADNGVDVAVYDCNAKKMQVKDFLEQVSNKQYDYILVKATAPSINLDLLFCKKLKDVFPDSNIVICGHVAKILKNYIEAKIKEIDYVVDTSMEQYVFNVILQRPGELTMDDLPSPNYQLVDNMLYNDGDKHIGYLWSSKGCNLKCSYCPYYAFYGDKIHYRSIHKVIGDIKYLVSLGINYVQFRDPFFTSNRRRVIELCNAIIDSGMDFKWFCETRVDTLDKSLIELMYKAGCRSIAFGVESADATILKKYGRPIYDYKKAIENVEFMKTTNITSLAFYMVGFPEDTYETVSKTFELAKSINSDYTQFNVFSIYPDTKLYSEDVDPSFFIEGENMTRKHACHAIPRSELESIAKEFRFVYNMTKFGLEYAIKEDEYALSSRERGKKMFNRHRTTLIEEVMA